MTDILELFIVKQYSVENPLSPLDWHAGQVPLWLGDGLGDGAASRQGGVEAGGDFHPQEHHWDGVHRTPGVDHQGGQL